MDPDSVFPTRSLRLSVGKQLQRQRTDADMSLAELGRRSGIHRSYISHIEKGNVNPSIGVLECLSRHLGCALHVELTQRGKN